MNSYQKFSLFSAFITGIIIFYVSSLSGFTGAISKVSFISVFYHFGIFFLFGLFVLFSGRYEKEWILFAILFCSFYAGLDEYHQLFVPDRMSDIYDFLTDFLGILFSSFVFIFSRRFINRS